VCWKPCSSCWSFHLLREEFLSAPIHSPSLVRRIGPSMRWDRMACVEAKQGAVAEHPSDGENLKTSKTTLQGLVSLVIK
jgi:hypothetical protein